MSTVSEVLGDKLKYTQIDLKELDKKKGFYYFDIFLQSNLHKIQSSINDNGSYSLIIFQNKDDIITPVPSETELQSIKHVELEPDEISVDKYKTLSADQQGKYYPIHVQEDMSTYKIVKYKLKPVVKVIKPDITEEEYNALFENDKNAYFKEHNGFYYLVPSIREQFYNNLSENIKQKFNPESRDGSSGYETFKTYDKLGGGNRGGKKTKKLRRNMRKTRGRR